jgi:hypothetical protein
MASMTQPTLTSPLPLFTRQRVALMFLFVAGLAASIALVAIQFQSSVATVTTPSQVAVPVAPDGTTTIVGAYEALQNQRQAAVQALQSGNTEAYEIAMSGAQALESRIASLQSRQPALTDRERTIAGLHEQLQSQHLAAAQALQSGNSEAYEIAVSGAQALQSRIASVQAGQPVVSDRERSIVDLHDQLTVQRLAAMQALQAGDTEGYEIAMSGAEALQSRIASLEVVQPALTEQRDRTLAIVELYEQLQLQQLAAAQALRDGNTEAFEIAMSGAEALRSRIASLQTQP